MDYKKNINKKDNLKENHIDSLEMINSEANKYLKDAFILLKNKAESSEYNIEDGKKIISAMPLILREIASCIEYKKSDIIQTKESGFFDQYVTTCTIRTHTLSLKYSPYWQTFCNEVKRLSEKMNIRIETVIYYLGDRDESKLLKESDFPMVIQKKVNNSGKYLTHEKELDDIGFNYNGLVLRLRATCEISNQYIINSNVFTSSIEENEKFNH